MDWPAGTEFMLFEEIKHTMIDVMKPKQTFQQSEIQDTSQGLGGNVKVFEENENRVIIGPRRGLSVCAGRYNKCGTKGQLFRLWVEVAPTGADGQPTPWPDNDSANPSWKELSGPARSPSGSSERRQSRHQSRSGRQCQSF
jgi:hypothetical protein